MISVVPSEIIRYRKKVSGPLLDRIDLIIEVPRLTSDDLISKKSSLESLDLKKTVLAAREIQTLRFQQRNKSQKPIFTNSEMKLKDLEEYCRLEPKAENLLKTALDKFGLSARSYHRILKISRTIADLDASEIIKYEEVAEALQYKTEFSWNLT